MTSGDSLLLLESDPPPSCGLHRALQGHLEPAHPHPTSQQRPGLWSSEDTTGWLASPPWGPLHLLRSWPGPLLSSLPGLGRGRGVAPEKPSAPPDPLPSLPPGDAWALVFSAHESFSEIVLYSCWLAVPLPLLEQASGGKQRRVPRTWGVPRMQ